MAAGKNILALVLVAGAIYGYQVTKDADVGVEPVAAVAAAPVPAASALSARITELNCSMIGEHPKAIGSVMNTGPAPIDTLKIAITFRTSDGHLVARDTAHVANKLLQPGQTTGFEMVTHPGTAPYDKCQADEAVSRGSVVTLD